MPRIVPIASVEPSGTAAAAALSSAVLNDPLRRLPDTPISVAIFLALAQGLVQEGECARPRELRGGLVVARRAVVVEAMVDVRVDERLVADAVGLQRLLVRRPACVDALVEARVVQHQRCLD